MAKQEKVDLYRRYPSEYVTPKEPVFVVLGPAKYLSITGHGAPGGKHFRAHVSALYSVAFTLKMAEKFAAMTTRSAIPKVNGGPPTARISVPISPTNGNGDC